MSEHDKRINALHDDLSRMQARNRELERQLAEAVKGIAPEAQETVPEMILVESMVSHRTGSGMVTIKWGSMIAQLQIPESRQLAFQLLEAGEAAVSDAFLLEFYQEKIGMKREEMGPILIAFREWRDAKEKSS